MFHSHSYEEKVFNFFASFLNNVIIGKEDYKDLVKPIISDAHKLATGEKNFYKLDRNGYSVIVYLVETQREYFKDLDVENLTNDNYSYILDLVKQQRNLLVS